MSASSEVPSLAELDAMIKADPDNVGRADELVAFAMARVAEKMRGDYHLKSWEVSWTDTVVPNGLRPFFNSLNAREVVKEKIKTQLESKGFLAWVTYKEHHPFVYLTVRISRPE